MNDDIFRAAVRAAAAAYFGKPIDVVDRAMKGPDDCCGWGGLGNMNDNLTAALEAAGLLQDEYPDQMAQQSCTCEDDAICGAHRLLAHYDQLFDAFQQSNREKREAKAALHARDRDLATARTVTRRLLDWVSEPVFAQEDLTDAERAWLASVSPPGQRGGRVRSDQLPLVTLDLRHTGELAR